MADFWDKYQEATNATDPLTKLKGLTECITECDDNAIKRLAAYDLGIALYQGKDGFPQDKDKGKRLMQLSADLDYGPAMNLYGQMLTHEGDMESITYFCMGLDAGEIMAAKNLHDLYKACSENGASQVCNAITAGVGEVARIQREDKPEDENGKSSLALALIGLYGLGGQCGISVEQGEEYLQQAAAKGNGTAGTMIRNPELKGPATALSFNPFKEEKETADSAPLQGDAVDEPAAKAEEKDSDPMTMKDWLKFGGIVLGGALILRRIGVPLLIGIAVVLFVLFKFF